MYAEQLFYNIAAMNALFSSMAWCAAKPTKWSILATAASALIWPFVNGILEGNLLLKISSTHGITVSDLLSVLAVVIALVQTMRIRRSRRLGQPATERGNIAEKS
ncbi:MAG: hypothetical protein QOH94_1348 [Mycobacterium sp.]|jgi:hypothetical protein|nr:hypothetical protein [Mycobacterium sp.]